MTVRACIASIIPICCKPIKVIAINMVRIIAVDTIFGHPTVIYFIREDRELQGDISRNAHSRVARKIYDIILLEVSPS